MLKHIPPVGSAAGQHSQRTAAATPTVASPPPPPLITTTATTTIPARSTRSLLNRSQQPLNVSTLSTATLNGGIGSSSLLQTHNHNHSHHHHHHPPPPQLNISTNPHNNTFLNQSSHTKLLNGNPPRMSSFPTPLPSLSSNSNQLLVNNSSSSINNNCSDQSRGAREALTSLGLLCLVSLLLALLSLIFLLKISPGGRDLGSTPPPPSQQSLLGPTSPEEYIIVYDVTLALVALSLSLNLCCLLVCCVQFLFAVKLIRTPPVTSGRGNKYLQKSSVSRVCAVGGFFISIPIFLTGIILYTFTQFHSTPAIVTSILIGVGIVFCGGAMVHNVFIWQKEKTISVQHQHKMQQQQLQQQHQQQQQHQNHLHHNSSHMYSHQNSRQTPLNLNLSMNSPISTIPTSFMNHVHNTSNHNHLDNINNHSYVNGGIGHLNASLNNTLASQMSQGVTQLTPVTPLSVNHSHISFNHNPPYISSTFGTTTPPTPKIGNGGIGNSNRDNGSISPGMPPTSTAANLELSNMSVLTAHELSTLV